MAEKAKSSSIFETLGDATGFIARKGKGRDGSEDTAILHRRYITVFDMEIQYPSGERMSFDVVGRGGDCEATPQFVCVFAAHTRKGTSLATATLLSEFCWGPREFLATLPCGAYEPNKHRSLLHAAVAELREEGHLCGGRWLSLLPPGSARGASQGVVELKWGRGRFFPLLVLDPEVDPNPPAADSEEVIRILPHVSLADVWSVIMAGRMQLHSVQTSSMALNALGALSAIPEPAQIERISALWEAAMPFSEDCTDYPPSVHDVLAKQQSSSA